MEFTSEKYRAEIQATILKLWLLEGKPITPTTASEKRLLAYSTYTPQMAATYRGDGQFEIDAYAGACRWHGTSVAKEVRRHLRKCGFGPKEISSLLKELKTKEGPCPYYY